MKSLKFLKDWFLIISFFLATVPPGVAGPNDTSDDIDDNSCYFNLSKRLVTLLPEQEAFLATYSERRKFVYEAGNVNRFDRISDKVAGLFMTDDPKKKEQVSSGITIFCLVTALSGCVLLVSLILTSLVTFGVGIVFSFVLDAITNGFGYAYNKFKGTQSKQYLKIVKKFGNNEKLAEKELKKLVDKTMEVFKTDNDSVEIFNIIRMLSIINDAKKLTYRRDGKEFNRVVGANLVLPSKYRHPLDRRDKILQVKGIIIELDAQGRLCEPMDSNSSQKEPDHYFSIVKSRMEAKDLDFFPLFDL